MISFQVYCSTGCLKCQALFSGSCRDELLADQSQPNQPCSHRKFRVFGLLWFRAGSSQLFRLFGKGEAKLNIAFQLSGMESVFPAVGRFVELKQPKFNRPFREKGMVVGHVIVENSHEITSFLDVSYMDMVSLSYVKRNVGHLPYKLEFGESYVEVE